LTEKVCFLCPIESNLPERGVVIDHIRKEDHVRKKANLMGKLVGKKKKRFGGSIKESAGAGNTIGQV